MNEANERTVNTVKYVNSLMLEAVRKDDSKIMLKQSEGVPGLSNEATDLVIPGYDNVLNRLKVLCGLNPVAYKEPADGKIQLRINGAIYLGVLHVEDHVEDPFCVLELKQDAPQD